MNDGSFIAQIVARGYSRVGRARAILALGRCRMSDNLWDVFISHASEDKDAVARPLAEALTKGGARVWLDEHELKLGDSLTGKIDHGLARSRFGVVILSDHFFAKKWPRAELAGLRAMEEDGKKVILPIWHGVDK